MPSKNDTSATIGTMKPTRSLSFVVKPDEMAFVAGLVSEAEQVLFAAGYEVIWLADVEAVNGVADTNVQERPNDDALAASFGKFTKPAPPPATSRVARTVGSNVG
ncbi:MAG: hypothetical protein ASARMPREDX12_006624 [Alectoria sarmentosa]|nr:MAG: hypothetical protein ASARMPREDX12_006624 [Alectoria sarmentosa]